MKIKTENKKIKKSSIKMLKLILLKKKLFNQDCFYEKYNINREFQYSLKKALAIVRRYCSIKKKILFIGVPVETLKKNPKLKNSRHVFLPTSLWVRGLLTNRHHVAYKINSKKIDVKTIKFIRPVFKKINKVNLVIVLDTQNCTDILKETTKRNIPLITLSSNNDPFNSEIEYYKPDCNIIGNFDYQNNKKMILFILSLFLQQFKR